MVVRLNELTELHQKGIPIKRLHELLLLVSLVLLTVAACAEGELGDTYATEWRGGATGAYSFAFESGMPGQWQYAVPILNERDIKATFFLNGGSVAAWYCSNQSKHIHVPQMLDIAAAGHEIGSHSYDHWALVDLNDTDVHAQMSRDREFFNYFGIYPVSFAYPFSQTDERVRTIVGQYVEFARGGYPMVTNSSSWEELNPLDLRWSSRGENHYECVDLAIATGTWAVGVLHQVGQESHEAEPTVEEFSAFVEYVAGCRDAGELWVDTFGHIASYIRERHVAVITERYDAETNTISIYVRVDLGYPYIVPLTLRTRIDEYAVRAISQSQMAIAYQLLWDESGGVVQYDAVPDGGEVRIELGQRQDRP